VCVSRPPSRRVVDEARLCKVIREIFANRGETYSPRVLRELAVRGVRASKRRVERSMRGMGITRSSPRRRLKTTIRDGNHPVAPNELARDFTAARSNERCVTDITYVWTDEGWVGLPRHDPRPLLAYRRPLGAGHDDHDQGCHDRASERCAATSACGGSFPPLRPRLPVHERRIPHAPRDARRHGEHEPNRQLLGQRRRRIFLYHAQTRARRPPPMAPRHRAAQRDLRVHRGLLQPPSLTLVAQLRDPRAVEVEFFEAA
jgi:hypothetical protein